MKGLPDSFIPVLSSEEMARERAKARELRSSQWWKRKKARGICDYCGGKFKPSELTMDHIIPLIRGGRSTKGNVAACCKECNNKKKHKLLMEWEDYLKQS